jgi:small conductance mechanosensitive channel
VVYIEHTSTFHRRDLHNSFADSSVNLVVRPWVKKEDYWGVRFDVTRKIKEAFDENGIEIPFPQSVVHVASEEAQ